MVEIDQEAPVPPELARYVRDPVPEKYTVEIFEDLHAVIDEHLIEIARDRGSEKSDEALIKDWEKTFQEKIEKKRTHMHEQYGAWLPYAFIAGEIKIRYLINAGHPEYSDTKVPDAVVEVMQEFLEIVTYRDELGE